MTPVQAISQLDRQLARHGQDVTLTRIVTDGDDLKSDGVRAFVRGYTPDELTGGIQQGDSLIVLSPTRLPVEFADEPLEANDSVVVAGRKLNIESVNPVQIAGVTVRINLQVRG